MNNTMLKKFLFIITSLLCTTFASAQKIESQIQITGEIGVDTYKSNSFGLDGILGVRVFDQFRLGAGLGISYIDLFYDSYDGYRENAAYVPVFANAKYNLNKGKVSPFLNLDLGYSLYVPFSDYAKRNSLGCFINPSFGIDFKIDEGAIFVQAGYKYQCRKFELWVDPNGNYSQATISVGYQF